MGGMTAHKTFGIPLFDESRSTPSQPLVPLFTTGHRNAHILKISSLIVIDEAPMMHRAAFDMIDRFLRELMQSSEPFGGKTVICTGDYGQTSPNRNLECEHQNSSRDVSFQESAIGSATPLRQ